jgi:hypothetical protein
VADPLAGRVLVLVEVVLVELGPEDHDGGVGAAGTGHLAERLQLGVEVDRGGIELGVDALGHHGVDRVVEVAVEHLADRGVGHGHLAVDAIGDGDERAEVVEVGVVDGLVQPDPLRGQEGVDLADDVAADPLSFAGTMQWLKLRLEESRESTSSEAAAGQLLAWLTEEPEEQE